MITLAFISVALVIFLSSYWAIGRLRRYLIDQQIVDTPNERTLHQGSIPRGGGLVIVAALLFILLLVLGLHFTAEQLIQQLGKQISNTLGLSWLLYIFLIGWVLAWAGLSWHDDKVSLSPKFRFLWQIIFAVIGVCVFSSINQIQLSDTLAIDLTVFGFTAIGFTVTVIGVVWLANLTNFMDGMDGLVASQTIIASITLSFWFYQYGDLSLSLICVALAASSYAFLLWNWQPAKIFLGDVGSITIGAFFALLCIIGVNQYNMPILSFVMLFAVLIYDASVTLILRMSRKEKFWLPHRKHHYQRLAAMGYAHKNIVFAMMVLMFICASLATLSIQYHVTIWLCALIILMLLILSSFLVSFLKIKSIKNNSLNNNI